MKDKILMLIIGVLIGAVITAGGFMLFGKNNKGEKMDRKDFDVNMIGEDGGRGQRNRDGNSIEEPPAKPDDTSTENSNETM